MNEEIVLAAICGGIAAVTLLCMMRRRQLHLIKLLKDYVDRQSTWTRRRMKAEALASQIAQREATAAEKLKAALTEAMATE